MAQKWLINKIIKVLSKDELTVNEVVSRLQDEGKNARNVTRMQVAGLLAKNSDFEKAKDPINSGTTKLRHATVWRNKNVMD